jgi:hypothetical protein
MSRRTSEHDAELMQAAVMKISRDRDKFERGECNDYYRQRLSQISAIQSLHPPFCPTPSTLPAGNEYPSSPSHTKKNLAAHLEEDDEDDATSLADESAVSWRSGSIAESQNKRRNIEALRWHLIELSLAAGIHGKKRLEAGFSLDVVEVLNDIYYKYANPAVLGDEPNYCDSEDYNFSGNGARSMSMDDDFSVGSVDTVMYRRNSNHSLNYNNNNLSPISHNYQPPHIGRPHIQPRIANSQLQSTSERHHPLRHYDLAVKLVQWIIEEWPCDPPGSTLPVKPDRLSENCVGILKAYKPNPEGGIGVEGQGDLIARMMQDSATNRGEVDNNELNSILEQYVDGIEGVAETKGRTKSNATDVVVKTKKETAAERPPVDENTANLLPASLREHVASMDESCRIGARNWRNFEER